MVKTSIYRRVIFLLVLLLLAAAPFHAVAAETAREHSLPARAAQDVEELIEAINSLRNENGLASLSVHPVLMQITQAHAEYMAVTDQITHFQPDGKRPFQRALEAGFPVAGDLSLGGFYSENIVAGPGMTPQQAVQVWLGDDPHTSTMLSEWRSHMGVGVAYNGHIAYYVLDTALYSSEPISQTVVAEDIPTQGALRAPIVMNTPQADGSIHHEVHNGETLWAIAAVYNITLDTLIQLNALKSDQFIYPGDQLVIRVGLSPTSSPAFTAETTRQYESTPIAVHTDAPSPQNEAQVLLAPTPTRLLNEQPAPKSALDVVVPIAVAAAFLLMVVILWNGFRRGKME